MKINTLADSVPTYEEMIEQNLDYNGFYNDSNNPVTSNWFDNLLNAGTTIAQSALAPNNPQANLTQAQRNALLAQQRANQSPMSTQTILLLGAVGLGLVLLLKKRR